MTETPCAALVYLKTNIYSAGRRRYYVARPCRHPGEETEGPLSLCLAHARMAREGLLDEKGDSGGPTDLRNRRNGRLPTFTWTPQLPPKETPQ